jgi:hypothetical protein
MHVLEHRLEGASPGKAACAHFTVQGARRPREYLLTAGRVSVTVYAGRWIRDLRGLGKTCWSREALVAAYKQDGPLLAEYVDKLGVAWGD